MLTGRPSRSSNAGVRAPTSAAHRARRRSIELPRTPLRRTETCGGSSLCHDVTVASRYRVSRSRGVFSATQSSADPRNASWLSSPAVACRRIDGVAQPHVRYQFLPPIPGPWSLDGHAPAVGGHADHVRAPRTGLREHLEPELLVVGPVAARDEEELRHDHGDDHHPPPNDPEARAPRPLACPRCTSRPTPSLLDAAQALCVALPAAGLPAFLSRFTGRGWSLVAPLAVVGTAAVVTLTAASADVLTWIAFLLVPPGCALALGWAMHGARPWMAVARHSPAHGGAGRAR